MPAKMSKRAAVPVATFYDLLHTWLTTTNEPTIGDVDNYTGHTPWLWVTAGGHDCRLHADSQREGIATLLRLHRGTDHLEWHVVANNRGNFNKVAFGPTKQVIPGIYLYLAKPTHHGRRLV